MVGVISPLRSLTTVGVGKILNKCNRKSDEGIKGPLCSSLQELAGDSDHSSVRIA